MAARLESRVVQRPPTYVTLAKIDEMEKARSDGAGFGGVYGFVDPHFTFGDEWQKDWKMVDQAKHLWKFQGTVLVLQVSPEMFLPSEYLAKPDVLLPIRQHEDLHIGDAGAIVRQALPQALKADWGFQRLFLKDDPIPDHVYAPMIRFKQIEEEVEKAFAKLWNDKVDKRDTTAAYKPVADAVHLALAKYTNVKR
jgi:hypothetical protein